MTDETNPKPSDEPKKPRRVHALTNSFSGAAGEARVAAELVRCGIRVAKPYWTDDEIDLLVLANSGIELVSLPIQVKSVQNLSGDTKNVYIQGLKKRYVARSPYLSLAIYKPDTDQIWLVCGSGAIKTLHADQALRAKTSFDDLADDADVSIRVDDSLSSFEVDYHDAKWISQRIQELADKVAGDHAQVTLLSSLWPNA